MHLLYFTLFPLLGHYALQTLANTEIINFAAGKQIPVVSLEGNWTVLHQGSNEITVRDRTPAPPGSTPNPLCEVDNDGDDDVLLLFERRRLLCPHDLWIALDLDLDGEEWMKYDRFTLRVSWPASHPAQVALTMHTVPTVTTSPTSEPAAAASSSARTTRLHIARIHLTQAGIRVPTTAVEHQQQELVSLIVRLEPLILGVLPMSVIPVVWTLLGVLGVGTFGVFPWVWRMVEQVVKRARNELELEVEEKKAS